MESAIPDNMPPAVASRWHQMFPVLAEPEIARVGRFGSVHRYERGARLFAAGEPSPGMFVVLRGVVALNQRDGLGHVVPIARLGRGRFSGEIAQLSGGHALVDGQAEEDVEALLVLPSQLRALIINRLIVPTAVEANDDTVHRHARLGGTLNFYYRKAA